MAEQPRRYDVVMAPHHGSANTLPLVAWQRRDSIYVGCLQQALTFRLQPTSRHHSMAHYLCALIRQNMQTT